MNTPLVKLTLPRGSKETASSLDKQWFTITESNYTEINKMNEINLEQLDTILTANNFSRVCANSWIYRATLCNVYLDIIKGECDLRFESTGNHFMAINYSMTLKQFDVNKLPSQVSTVCDMLSDVSSRTVAEVNNIFVALTDK